MIIGGGIGGLSAAYHLANLGVEDMVDVWRAMCTLGKVYDLRVGGHLAEEAVDIARGVPALGRAGA